MDIISGCWNVCVSVSVCVCVICHQAFVSGNVGCMRYCVTQRSEGYFFWPNLCFSLFIFYENIFVTKFVYLAFFMEGFQLNTNNRIHCGNDKTQHFRFSCEFLRDWFNLLSMFLLYESKSNSTNTIMRTIECQTQRPKMMRCKCSPFWFFVVF